MKLKNPVKALLMEKGLKNDNGLFSAYRGQKEYLREAKYILGELLSDRDLQARADRIAQDHNHSIKVGKTEMKILREDFEKGEKLIPEVVVERYVELKKIADRPEKKLEDFLREFPKVKKAMENVASADWSHAQAAHRLERFVEEHPLKAAVKIGKGYRLSEEEGEAREILEKAQGELDKTWNDPKIRKKAGQLSDSWMLNINRAREQFDELTPFYERAIERMEKDRELGLYKDLSNEYCLGHGSGEGEDHEKAQDQEMELKLEKGFGFDRGFGF